MSVKAQFPEEQGADGEFTRQEDAFREWITSDGSTPFVPEAGRYHLYVSLACPWASRTVILRKLKRLENAVGMTVADPIRDDRTWAFRDGPGHTGDSAEGFQFLKEAYTSTDPDFEGRVTVPVLWDTKTRQIVNNSEDDICRMFNGAFRDLADGVDLFPAQLEDEQSKLATFVYEKVNNGVYRAGFATRQQTYESACQELFQALDELDARLAHQRYLLGPSILEVDWRLFCTLIRFDSVYHGHFKCNLRRVIDYSNLHGYLLDLYQQPGIAETVNLDHIKRHYYITHNDINPTQIVPIGPILDLERPHGRGGI
jgi:glutathionyl-hydroquinone reductase